MKGIYLGLGSNLGDRNANLQRALTELNELGIRVNRISSTVETEPVGGPAQGKYLNAAVQVETTLSPEQLLQAVKSIEKKMGRRKSVRNAPRIIDIDILLFNDQRIATKELTIPHPRMFERQFVMGPLREIAAHVKKNSHEDH